MSVQLAGALSVAKVNCFSVRRAFGFVLLAGSGSSKLPHLVLRLLLTASPEAR